VLPLADKYPDTLEQAGNEAIEKGMGQAQHHLLCINFFPVPYVYN
jgi:hypothetical protein